MKKLIAIVFVFASLISYSQAPGIRWSRFVNTFLDGEVFYDLRATPDHGYIAVGADSLFAYDKYLITHKSFGGNSWIVKMDSAGNINWQAQNPTSPAAGFGSVTLSTDGGYVTAGWKLIISGWDTASLTITKYSGTGNLVWERTYGGTRPEKANSIIRTSSGGYAITGFTNSNDGDVSGNHSPGFSDVWLLKTAADGSIIWKKCFGGSAADTGYAVIQTPDKGFVVAGSSTSSNGDLTGNNGLTDAWLFKTDSMGVLQWQKNFGGVGQDVFKNLVLNADGSYTVTGYTTSATATSNGNKGKSDLWVARIDNAGNIIWTKGFGGLEEEEGHSITLTQDNSFIVSGYTESNTIDVSNNNGLSDIWVIKISSAGNLIWQKCVGTAKEEFSFAGVYLTENNFTVGGTSRVGPVGSFNETDGYVVNLGNTSLLRVQLVAPYLINEGLAKAIKPTAQFAAIPVNNLAQMNVDTGQYTVTFTPQNPYFNVSPPSVNVNFPNYFDTTIVLFTLTPIPGRRDLTISAVPLAPARPGFFLQYKLIYRNAGTDTVASGQVLFKRDSRINFNSANPVVSSINGDTLKWNYSNLRPFDTASITVNMTVQTPPSVNIGDTLTSLALITPLAGDLTPSDDSAIVRQRVIGGYDPNDKKENLGGKIFPQQVISGSYINYIIRFQNTGNDTAFNIVVRDTLDAKLDWNSFNMLAGSHPYSLQINSDNRLAWTFNNIKLVDSIRNEPASHGFIAYRIKPTNNLVVGDTIKNSASIYFDYNLPVRTNTQQTVVVNNIVTGLGGPQSNRFYLCLFPNPTGEMIWLNLKDQVHGEGLLTVTDMNGKLIYKKNLGNINSSNFTTSINLRNYPPGIYTIVLGVGKKLYSQKLILQ
jgi:uncharacterized repeat protein (TIGR01451 family)